MTPAAALLPDAAAAAAAAAAALADGRLAASTARPLAAFCCFLVKPCVITAAADQRGQIKHAQCKGGASDVMR